MKNLQEVTVPMGKDIKKVITEFILQNGWKQVYIIGAVGSVIDMVFTTPIQNYLPLKVSSVPVHVNSSLHHILELSINTVT